MEETKEIITEPTKTNKEQVTSHEIIVEQVRKTKKNEPKIFPFIVMIDKQAFADLMD